MVKKRMNNALIKPTTFAIIIYVFIINMLYISQLQRILILIVHASIETEFEYV